MITIFAFKIYSSSQLQELKSKRMLLENKVSDQKAGIGEIMNQYLIADELLKSRTAETVKVTEDIEVFTSLKEDMQNSFEDLLRTDLGIFFLMI